MRGEDFVVMWQDSDGHIHNVEKGDRAPTEQELEDSERTVLGYVDEDGHTRYLTVLGGFDDTFDPMDAVEAYIDADPDRYAPMMPGQA